MNVSALFCFLIDNEPPVFHDSPSSITAFVSSIHEYASVTWNPPNATDNSAAPVQVSAGHNPGNFQVGSLDVTYTATDGHDNEASYTFTINVIGKKL